MPTPSVGGAEATMATLAARRKVARRKGTSQEPTLPNPSETPVERDSFKANRGSTDRGIDPARRSLTRHSSVSRRDQAPARSPRPRDAARCARTNPRPRPRPRPRFPRRGRVRGKAGSRRPQSSTSSWRSLWRSSPRSCSSWGKGTARRGVVEAESDARERASASDGFARRRHRSCPPNRTDRRARRARPRTRRGEGTETVVEPRPFSRAVGRVQ